MSLVGRSGSGEVSVAQFLAPAIVGEAIEIGGCPNDPIDLGGDGHGGGWGDGARPIVDLVSGGSRPENPKAESGQWPAPAQSTIVTTQGVSPRRGYTRGRSLPTFTAEPIDDYLNL